MTPTGLAGRVEEGEFQGLAFDADGGIDRGVGDGVGSLGLLLLGCRTKQGGLGPQVRG